MDSGNSRLRPWAELVGDASSGPVARTTPSRRGHSDAAVDERPWWASHPKRYTIAGAAGEFHYVSALARALGRSSATIRQWERQGVIPVAPYFKRTAAGTLRPLRRLYPRAYIEAAVRIAGDEGLVGHRPQAWAACAFSDRLHEAWHELARAD
jgi:hypothetical protein